MKLITGLACEFQYRWKIPPAKIPLGKMGIVVAHNPNMTIERLGQPMRLSRPSNVWSHENDDVMFWVVLCINVYQCERRWVVWKIVPKNNLSEMMSNCQISIRYEDNQIMTSSSSLSLICHQTLSIFSMSRWSFDPDDYHTHVNIQNQLHSQHPQLPPLAQLCSMQSQSAFNKSYAIGDKVFFKGSPEPYMFLGEKWIHSTW